MSKYLQSNKNKKMGPKGFYIALGVCMIAIGAAAWATYDSAMNYTGVDTASSTAQALPTEKTVSGVKAGPLLPPESEPASLAPSQAPVSSAPPASSAPAKEQPAKATAAKPAPPAYSFPAGKNVGQKFSENPVYSKTMKDWRAHTGTDFNVEAGSGVQAISSGIVQNVYTDGLYGQTVAIAHGSITAYYCGLENITVKNGDKLNAGAKLGTVSAVPSEAEEPLHLHFMLMQNKKWIDPMTLLK